MNRNEPACVNDRHKWEIAGIIEQDLKKDMLATRERIEEGRKTCVMVGEK